MNWLKTHYQQLMALLIVIVVGTIVMWPLTQPGLFTAHDIWHQVARFYHYHATLAEGFWPPGWIVTLANGYGYPLFYFSYHLPWMVGEVLLRTGCTLPEALKLLFGGAVVASGLTMYWFCWSITKKIIPSLAGAIVYILAPYHFLTVYVAAAIGSVFQFVFVPLMFLGVYEIVVKKTRARGIMLLSFGFAGSLLSHLMSTVMVTPFVFLWLLLLLILFARDNGNLWLKAIVTFALASIFAVGLAAFYLLPLFSYKSAIIADSAGGFRSLYETNFVSLKQLLYSPWGFGPITSNAKDGEISMQIGVVQWLGVIALAGMLLLTLGNRIVSVKRSKLDRFYQALHLHSIFDLKIDVRLPIAVVLLFGTICLAMLSLSQPLWRFANEFMTLDYPWRLLLLAVFFGSTVVALSLSYVKAFWMRLILIILLVACAWYTNRNHIGVNLYTQVPVEDYVDAETTTNTFAEYLPVKANDAMMRNKNYFILEPSAVATISAQSAIYVSAQATVSVDGKYTLHQYAFPTLQVSVDDRPVTTSISQDGLLQILLTQGKHLVEITVIKTPTVRIGTILSLLTFSCLLGYILVRILTYYVKK